MIEKRTIHNLFQSSPERLQNVQRDIADGSEPGLRFYLMVLISTMIAGMGLVTNSTAVIIGAMLVAPLMTPIFGISLALIQSDAKLLGHAIQAEAVGVLAAIGMGFLLGCVYPGLEATPEMLSRTNPQLFDLLVAVFSGFAGAYALVDEKISPALPGVAIATAIVPPLANTGLCISLGAYNGAIGSFLLFFSNFLSILLVGAIVFSAFGMAQHYQGLDTRTIFRKFGLPIISFVLIAGILSQSLYSIWLDQERKDIIQKVLTRELRKLPSVQYEKAIYKEENDTIYVFADVHSARPISPRLVSTLQKHLADAFAKKTELALRLTLAQTVNALESRTQMMEVNLDGEFVNETPALPAIQAKIADTTIRNHLTDFPGAVLKFVNVFLRGELLVVVASIDGIFPPDVQEIQKVEQKLRQNLEEPQLHLIVRFSESSLYDSNGLYQLDLAGFVDLSEEQTAQVVIVKDSISNYLDKIPEVSISNINHTMIEGQFHFLIELSTISIFSIEQVKELEAIASKASKAEVVLHVLSKPEVLTTAKGYEPYNTFRKKAYEVTLPKVQAELRQILLDAEL